MLLMRSALALAASWILAAPSLAADFWVELDPSQEACRPAAAAERAVYLVARDAGASEATAQDLAESADRFVSGRPRAAARSGPGACRFQVSVDQASVRSALNASAFCQAPVALLVRALPVEGLQTTELEPQSFQNALLSEYDRRDFILVDVSEQNPFFEQLVREDRDCVHLGGLDCGGAREFGFMESILDVLRSTQEAIAFHNGTTIDASKYFPLQEGGVLVFVQFEPSLSGRELRLSYRVESRYLSNAARAWVIPNESISASIRRQPVEQALIALRGRVAEQLALASARQCAG